MAIYLRVDQLTSDGNVRSEIDAALAESIKQNGIMNPLVVYRRNNTWVIKEGHRRLTGAIVAGLNEVPCVEVAPPAGEAEQIAEQFIINQHRKELPYLDQAKVYQRLRYEFGWPQKKIAQRFGVSESSVSLALAALRAHPIIRDALLEGKISPSAAELVTSLDVEEQGKIAAAVVKAKTVRKIADVVNTFKKTSQEQVAQKPAVEEHEDAEEIDPFEEMAVSAIEEAANHLLAAEGVVIKSAAMRKRGIKAVNEIASILTRLSDYLNAEEPAVAEYVYENA